MATSVYFNNQKASIEQQFLEDLIIESVKNHGIDVYYIVRESQSSIDELFGDDPVKTFKTAIKMEMYLETFQDYEGNKEFFSKFGLEIQETARLCFARRTFERLITVQFPESRQKPRDGDLIYLPVQYKLMEIKFVEEEKNFFQLGKDGVNPYMYNITVEAFRYNGELLQTGVSEIDRIADVQAVALELDLQPGGEGTFQHFEYVYQGPDFANATAKAVVANWDYPSRQLKIRNVKGTFIPNTAVYGVTSGAVWDSVVTPMDLMNNANFEDVNDNSRIESEANNIIDFTEINPFGQV